MDRKNTLGPDSRQRAAVMAALWTACLFATVPVVGMVQKWMLARGYDRWIIPAVVVALLLLVGAAVLHLTRGGSRPRSVDVAWLAAVAVVAGGWAWRLRGRPEEAVHLLEYGILCWLIYRAIRPAEPNAVVLLSAVLLGAIMGTVDEIIQWITPERVWDLRDVVLNAGACALGAVVAWRLDPGPWRSPDKRSARLALRLGAAMALLMTLCLANTPARVAWYSARFPGLAFLAHPTNEMAEYGHLLRVDGVGEFKSRVSLEEMMELDRRRSREAAEIIDRYPAQAYGRFLWDYQGFADPLTYEARVHIFSRDRNAWLARKSPPDSTECRLRATLAYRENQLLERVFPETLRHSVYVLNPTKIQKLRELHDPGLPFASRAATHLITWISEPALRAGLMLIALILVVLDLKLGVGWAERKEIGQ